ncbi:MAG: DUF4240 domain-containing protein [Myxococcota bacterium]
MDDTGYWELIETSRDRAADPEGQARRLTEVLSQQSAVEIQRFGEWFQRAMLTLYRWELWGVASLVHGHEDQESFVAFRAWVVSRGREVFAAAVEDADSLAPHVTPKVDGSPLTYVARDAYEAATGNELPTATLDLFAEPAGEPIPPSDLTTRFPKVAAKLAR